MADKGSRLAPLLQKHPPLLRGQMAFLEELVRRYRDGTCAIEALR
jgi:hypothetical protein